MKKEFRPVIITSIIVGAILIIALTSIIINSNMGAGDKITVQGVSSLDATPDLMTTYFRIETLGNTSTEAKDMNNEIADKLVDEILKLGLERNKLQTQSFEIYPNYEWSSGKQTQKGYKAIHSLKLELSSDEFDKISGIIDAGANSGAGISYINFELTQALQNQYKAEALHLASEDAQTKADAVASGFGKKAGKLISVQVDEFGYAPWNIYSARASAEGEIDYADEENTVLAKQAVAEITPGDQKITAIVSATFRII